MSVSVTVVAGRNLAAKDRTGFSDPYVVCKLFGIKNKVKKKKTKFIKQTLNPEWNETLELPVTDIRIQALHFVVWDKDRFGSDFMGQVTVTLKEVAQAKNAVDEWYTLDTNHKGEHVSGEINLRIKLTPPTGQENIFTAPEEKEEEKPEDTVSAADLIQMLKKEDTYNEGKEKVTDVYTLGKELGRGAFAVVKVATHKLTKRKYACKIIDRQNMGDSHETSLQREIDIMTKVDHPNVISLRQVFEDEKYVYLVMELVTGGELFDKIVEKGNYTERDAARLVYLMVDAISYLHEQGIAHRDLKPENLLLKTRSTDTDIKIADFGLSRMVNEATMMKTACGTPTYVAPEVLQATGYGPGVDMWSIGVIAYILLCGFPPFYGDTIPEMFEQIMSGEFDYPEEYWNNVSDDAKDFISKLLIVDTEKRLGAKAALEHPWLNGQAPEKELSAQFGRRLQTTVYERRQETLSNAIGADY